MFGVGSTLPHPNHQEEIEMHVATKDQIQRLSDIGDERMITPCVMAAHAINDIMNNWGNASSNDCERMAAALRRLADLVAD